jgi:hypothetical protein
MELNLTNVRVLQALKVNTMIESATSSVRYEKIEMWHGEKWCKVSDGFQIELEELAQRLGEYFYIVS